MYNLEITNPMQIFVIESLHFDNVRQARSTTAELLHEMAERISVEKPEGMTLEDYLRGMPSWLLIGMDYVEAEQLKITVDEYWQELTKAVSHLWAVSFLIK